MDKIIVLVKELIKRNKKLLTFAMIVYKYKRKYKSNLKMLKFSITGIFKFYTPSLKISRGMQIRKLFEKIKIKTGETKFIYDIDILKTLNVENSTIENTTIDYEICLDKSLEDMKKENDNMKEGDYKQSQKQLLLGIEELIDKEITIIKKAGKEEKYIQYFNNIKNKKAQGFEEALQRILFYNQMLWQTGHPLNGLGRLDKILEKYYEKDLKENKITKQDAGELINEFLKTLHQKYWYKSNSLLGDTGQVIILGGKEPDGKYFCNDLTYMFIEEVEKLQLPDPKVLLRVDKNVPRKLMETSVKCIKTGIGCPLFSNDEVVIPKLIEFGFEKNDAHNYVTAACWEPLITGKSFDQNNMKSIVFLKPFTDMLNTEELEKIQNLEQLMEKYKKYLEKYINEFFKQLDERKYEKDPLMSLFIPNCNKTEKDVTEGGAIYNNYGATSVSLANTVNSIINIDKFVFQDKKYTLKELNEIRKNNFENNENVQLKDQGIRYGKDDEKVLEITNTITNWVNELLKNKINRIGGKLKFGLSAPSYIDESKDFEASLDGRKQGDAFIVHISSDITSNPYTELIQFASKIDYSGNRFNGNVIDFMVTPSFMENNFEKFTDFLILSIDVGFFQMQMNVVSSGTLIKAKEHPEDFPNLIVRVWGFSAYFNDLPEEYKNVLIERALKNEGKSY